MNFKEFVLLNELRYYYAYKSPTGQYVSSDMYINPNERDHFAANAPGKVWKFEVKPGNPVHNASVFQNITNATPNDKENIGIAYYSRMGFHRHPTTANFEEPENSMIEPEVMDKDYYKKLAAAQKKPPFNMKPGGTFAFKPINTDNEKTINYR